MITNTTNPSNSVEPEERSRGERGRESTPRECHEGRGGVNVGMRFLGVCGEATLDCGSLLPLCRASLLACGLQALFA